MTAKTLVNRLNRLAIMMFLLGTPVWAQETKAGGVVQKGATVSIEYTIFDEQGVMIETNKGGNPVSYIQGEGQLIPGVDRALEGMRVGEKKSLSLKPEDAYGQINPAARMVVPKAKIPVELVKDAVVGAKFLAHAGRQIVPGRVEEVREDAVVVDMNHPLAGKTITVEIEVVNIIVPAQKPHLPAS